MKLLVAITNHNLNKQAIDLKKEFEPYVDTILIDNDSTFESDEQKKMFDYPLTNAYYNGQLNQAYSHLKKKKYTHLLFINSDVTIPHAHKLITRIKEVYTSYPEVAVYAPSAYYSSHNHMANLGTNNIRKVTFTDGFCFAMTASILDDVCPIDLEVNKIGHGTDMYMGFLAMKQNKWAVVDDFVKVNHPRGSSYNDKKARMERDDFYDTKSTAARVFHYWISKDILKNKFGYHFVRFLMKIYLPEPSTLGD